MKKILFYIFCMTITQQTISQTVKTFKLDNGFTVILAEEHSEPKVHGAVVAKAGSKNDPEDATGMAHYFEHIMFKGTDKIGTVDYEKEKPYLDQIATLYDELSTVPDNEVKRNEILEKINELSITANEYAIPGEVDKLLKKHGGTKINAYTSYDYTVYHNSFPPNQLEKWLKIYAERFRNPVFRMFQAELETVYEERNMYADRMGSKAIEDLFKSIVKKHPYRNPIIGTVKDLKNPSINKMTKFYKEYYVAGNMGLILVGDFVADEVIPYIKATFGVLPAGEAPEFPADKYQEAPFKVREFYSGRYIPLKAGIVCYRSIPAGHPDEIALNYCLSILSNESQTGLLDRLRIDNKLMLSIAQQLSLNDMGAIVVVFVPKLMRSLKKAESEIMNVISHLKSGNFSDELVEALRISFVKDKARITENKENFGNLLAALFSCGKSWDDYIDETNKYQTITRQDIIAAANKYFIDNRLVFYNKTGFSGKAEKIKKPPYKALASKNTDRQSVFANELEAIPIPPNGENFPASPTQTPLFVDFDKDFHYRDLQSNVHLITGNNPVNDIFTIKFKFGYGKNKDKLVELIPEHFNELGTDSKTVGEFRTAMQKLGASYYFTSSRTSVVLHVDGFDNNFDETMSLVNDYLLNIKADDKQMSKMFQSIRERNKIERKDPAILAEAHMNYVIIGEHSPYINRVSLKDVKKLKSEDIVNSFCKARNHETTITYVGKIPFSKVKDILTNRIQFPENVQPADKSFFEIKDYDSDMVSVFDYKKANQTHTLFYVPGEPGNENDILMTTFFNQYFGEGMTSLMFHEIRELRSLSYSVSAQYSFPNRMYSGFKGFLYGALATQADKTVEAVELADSLVKQLPQKPELTEMLKKSFKESINASRPAFRKIPLYGYSLIEQGYSEDLRKTCYDNINLFNMESIGKFHENFIKGRPLIFILTGNESKMALDRLKIKKQKVKLKDILMN
ncbi:MAG: insulinase family protein [Prevotellaceae bacterium]|jgi:predicted Zn-dependent peptidase|nr:insulinase family protein [Prevotellaceae bacterium]